MNEKFAPELLESKSEIVECVVEQLEHMVLNWREGRGAKWLVDGWEASSVVWYKGWRARLRVRRCKLTLL